MAVSDPHVIAEFMNSLEKKLDILRESYAENGGFEKLIRSPRRSPRKP